MVPFPYAWALAPATRAAEAATTAAERILIDGLDCWFLELNGVGRSERLRL